ncbi:integrin-alpha FG-GAP repeat-containing protein 2 isoform X2 [Fopius arisanus]|uniref:Integrin-alpha FG-GAP repeat-containing protein 2 isoform X2 n=1 Tax=Fopius arisanus TaxID=64838 RepID=A0A9R1U8M6_9HYME|nr:PREDICTED: integrin-alpha FG-GAP repeat-containing protein 2-like isoform X2 [Fopius arisanus]
MRAVNFVDRLQWDIAGNVFRHGLAIGDVDNDGDNELVVGTSKGDLLIFKGSDIWHKTTGLGLITCLAIGDIFNYGRNALVVICGDGWVHIFYSPRSVNPNTGFSTVVNKECLDNAKLDAIFEHNPGEVDQMSGKMECVHLQRIPTNTKIVLLADIDRDGANEMIIGLTDRVVRSYRWSSNADLGTGKLIGLNKWECANQIGTLTLQHTNDRTPTLLVAQPGGTFMRIKCTSDNCRSQETCVQSETAEGCIDYQTLGISRMRNSNISTEIIGNLAPGNKRYSSIKICSKKDIHESTPLEFSGTDQVDGNIIGGNAVRGEFPTVHKKTILPSYDDFTNNSCINNEGIIEIKDNNNEEEVMESKPYAVATLDGTIMLVKDEIILWAMQVDHQIFALSCLDVTADGTDEIVICTWDGQTYILDQDRNSVRFQFEEPVRSFCTGNYSLSPGTSSPSLVYITFTNKSGGQEPAIA